MNSKLYSKLAFGNLGKNKSTFVPFLLSATVMVSLYYMINAIYEIAETGEFYGNTSVSMVMTAGVKVMAVFSVIILFYINSFLMKRRKKELGLYSILGMEKRHISRVLIFELAYVGISSILVGILIGGLLGRLMFLILIRLLEIPVEFQFFFSWKAAVSSSAFFLLTFALLILYNCFKIKAQNPIDLMQSGRKGEKEPKAKWFLAIAGVFFLGWGYVLSLTSGSPLEAIEHFFFAVLFVIAGTYLVFTAGSIAFMKLLRKNKKFYYHPRHFTALSGMIYRMKQNAAGLAAICILSTCVILTLATTICTYVGIEGILKERFTKDVFISGEYQKGYEEIIHNEIQTKAGSNHLKLEDEVQCRIVSWLSNFQDGSLEDIVEEERWSEESYEVGLIPLEDYNKLIKGQEVLKPDEVIFASNRPYGKKQIEIAGKMYTIKNEIALLDGIDNLGYTNRIQVIGASMKNLELAVASLKPDHGYDKIRYSYGFNLSGDKKENETFCTQIKKDMVAYQLYSQDRFLMRKSIVELYGSVLFIGFFIGSVFMAATVLIIYYKQISEGFDDRERFQIMQKVGMSKEEVKKSIRGQILSVFFLPIAGAVLHIAFAFPIMIKILDAMHMTNQNMFLACTVLTVGVFILIYTIVYLLTAKTYYKIVN